MKKKNKNKGAKQTADEDNDKNGKSRKDFDDRFYDLDDNFIDDGDMQDELGAGFEGLGGPGGFDNEDFYGDLDAEMTSTVQ